MGKPDFSLLEDNYEARDKFYEPQYCSINKRRTHNSVSTAPVQCVDEQIEKADIQFRETESQLQHQEAVQLRVEEEQATDFYDLFM